MTILSNLLNPQVTPRLLDLDTTVTSIDLTTISADLRCFAHGFVVGTFGYFVPNQHEDTYERHGKFVKLNLTNFNTASATILDLTLVDSDLKGFINGFSDGTYAYLVQGYNAVNAGRITRVTLADFSTITILDVGATDTDILGFSGGFVKDGFGYFTTLYNENACGKIVKVNLTTFAVDTILNLEPTTIPTENTNLKGFSGGFSNGNYGYFVPFRSTSMVGELLCVDLTDFTTITTIDLTLTNENLKGFWGGVVYNDFGYCIPTINGDYFGEIACINLTDLTTVTTLNLTKLDIDLKGFMGGFVSGKYCYLVPYENSENNFFGKLVQVDLDDFSTVLVNDMTTTHQDLKGFIGGFAYNGYGYLVPGINGRITRFTLT